MKPREYADTHGSADVPVDAAWLATRIARVPYTVGRRRLDTVLFAQRVFGTLEAPDLSRADVREFEAGIATALRGYEAFPALMLALERIGVTDPAVLVTAARRAQALGAIRSPGVRRSAVIQFQSALGIVARARRAGNVSAATASGLAAALCEIEVSADRGSEGRLAPWFGDSLVRGLSSVSVEHNTDPGTASILPPRSCSGCVSYASSRAMLRPALGRTIGTAEEDQQRFVRYAAAYAAAGGPQQALVEQWKKTIDR